jgi:hypothetical protein
MISEYHIAMVKAIAAVAPRVIFKKFQINSCIAGSRIVMEVLKKFHFKNVKPLVVEANVFNETYVKKGRTPESHEEAQTWLEEGAWQVVLGERTEIPPTGVWPGHLVLLIDGTAVFDITAGQATRPNKNINITPMFTTVPDNFVRGEDKCGLIFNNCMVVYSSYPNDTSYVAYRDWNDLSITKAAVNEVYYEVKDILGKKI